MANGIVWIRNDLRLADNPALKYITESCDQVIVLFIWDESPEWSAGSASCWWLLQTIKAFDHELQKRGSRLVIRKGIPEKIIPELAKETQTHVVAWNRRYEKHLRDSDQELKTHLREQGLKVESFMGNLLLEPWNIANKSEKPFQVFTPFWNTLRGKQIPDPLPTIKHFPGSLRKIKSEPLTGLLEEKKWHQKLEKYWRPGEENTAKTFHQFQSHLVDTYDESRNIPGSVGTSRVSPSLHFGEISPRTIWHHFKNQLGKNSGVETFLKELAWREFAQHLLYHFPDTTLEPMNKKFTNFPWKFHEKNFESWKTGNTGYPMVDAGMRELWETGWMHNRVRMITASFLVKHLLISWQEGALWFWDTLVDADLSSNTMGWQWVAGCGADAAPYFRIFNPVLQGERFDPNGDYVRQWIPELAKVPKKFIHCPWEFSGRIDYPKPIVDHEQARQRALQALAQCR